jgi:hypothetical protein
MLSFFSMQKFQIDEALTIRMIVDSQELEFHLRMSHLHEQISSGRVMTALPTEACPFPARKFYRCFAQVIEVKRDGVLITQAPVDQPILLATAVSTENTAPTLQAVPDSTDVTSSEDESIPKAA